MSEFYRTPTRSTTTRAGAAIIRQQPSKDTAPNKNPSSQGMLSFDELLQKIQGITSLAEEIKNMYGEAEKYLEEAKQVVASVGTAKEFNTKHEEMKARVEHLVNAFGEVKSGPPGKDAEVDMEKIISEAAKRVPAPIIDEVKIAKRAARFVPKPTPQEREAHVDPGAIAQMLVEGGHLKPEHIKINGMPLDQHLRLMDEMARRNGVRGGGDTVAQGSGILITTNNNGQKVITATGTSLAVIAVTGTKDDSNLLFASVTKPTLLNINGSFYLPTGGAITWIWVTGVITLSSPVGSQPSASIFGV